MFFLSRFLNVIVLDAGRGEEKKIVSQKAQKSLI